MTTVDEQSYQDTDRGFEMRSSSPFDVVPSEFVRRKRVMDQLIAAMLLLPGLPTMALLIAVVKLTSPGPGIFRQQRVGKRGRLFMMYKIRTMACDAESATGPVWTTENDPRVTSIGRFLRHWHLDELPQLFNVLKGEMSIIGPRPERPEFVRVLIDHIPGYTNRLAVHPGITGLAQINLPADTDIDSVRRKQVLDCEYIQTSNLWLDTRILAWTAFRLLGMSCEFAARITGLARSISLSDVQTAPSPMSTTTPEQIIRPQEMNDTVRVSLTKTVEAPLTLPRDYANNVNGKPRIANVDPQARDDSRVDLENESRDSTPAVIRPKSPK